MDIFQTEETAAKEKATGRTKSAMPENGTTTCKKSVRFASNVEKVRRSLVFSSNEDITDMTDK